jgi:axin 1
VQATQLEEAKRRLEFEQNRNRLRYPSGGGGGPKQQQQDYELMPPMQSCMQSNQSTLRRTRQDAGVDFTTVVFSFCDEKVPYRTKIPGYNVTLKQFKDVLPKKGSYR